MFQIANDINQNLNGREIGIYGAGFYGEFMLELFSGLGLDIKFYIDRNYGVFNVVRGRKVFPKTVLDPQKHFVIISSIDTKSAISMRTDLSEMKFNKNDYFCFMEHADRDLNFFGTIVGRRSNFVTPFVFQYSKFLHRFTGKRVDRIGRFTNITSTAILGTNVSKNISVALNLNDIVPDIEDVTANRVEIGSDVWISANAFINASTVKSIGNGAIIGAGAIVMNDIPPYAIVTGAPAVIKKYRFNPEQIDILQRVQWWNWDNETIRKNKDCFIDSGLFFQKFG